VLMFFFFQEASISLSGASVDQQRVVEYGAIPYEISHPGDDCGLARAGSEGTRVVCEGMPGVRGEAPDQPPFWVTLFSSMFMHGGLLHLLGNMLFLWIFGNNIEDSMGRLTFLAFYLLGGFAALGLHILSDPNSVVPTVGASGAIAAVLGAYARLYPRARVVTLVFIIIIFTVVTLPALVVLGLWFLLQLLPAFSDPISGGGGGVAYFAHIGGFIFGLVAIKLFANNIHEDYERPHRIPVY
jgi:membrane associated rhomboid family serine protease